ncbi:glycoside hydrolase family 2 TIM barrel-domain containing protein [uncultured Sphaerochaeta sp.]|uniref:glycoside hydrolase family 2 TIM barrel-domain containing protein n=1 Tax=uncultured Sphaerochaeta sp. TaxID=886478 RepID=UPI002A0A8B8F|nr:glycoside hydrolase family 2 TIM barrel-domain containing protein [uncultured Sphaerochaeta sp.]
MNRTSINLSGTWKVILDQDDRGLEKKWNEAQNLPFARELQLPGNLEENRIGDPVSSKTEWIGSQFGKEFTSDPLYEPYREDDHFLFPYWLQPETRYIGPAWYMRSIQLPSSDASKTWELSLERPHWETQVWVDGSYLGSCDSLSVPHRYIFSTNQKSSVDIVIRVDNRMIWEVGPNAHSVSDQTQGNWNGLVGTLSLTEVPPISIKQIQLFSDIVRNSVLVELTVENRLDCDRKGIVAIKSDKARDLGGLGSAVVVAIPQGSSRIHKELVLSPDMQTWDEFHPELCTVEASVLSEGGELWDTKQLQAGIREVGTDRKHIRINGKDVFLRGTVECCVFPKTGYPPVDESSWERIFTKAKEYGLNHLRFHSWCPPEAAFSVADRLGFYVQIECPIWKNQGVAYTSEDGAFDNWLFSESQRIVDEYGNHPSFILFTSGNEPEGRYTELLGLWVSYWKQRDKRRLYTSASGWPALEENDYQVVPEPRIQAWGQGLTSRINAQEPETYTDYSNICDTYPGPVVTHEMGQWCVFPDFSEMKEYTGYLKPRNFEVFADILKRRGMSQQARDFLQASGKLQLLCYKEELEAAQRTANLAGYQLLALTDFPGQGTALEGVLNVFWQEKGYCTASDFKAFCNDIVLLARMEKRCFAAGEVFEAQLSLANYASSPLEQVAVHWSILDANGVPLFSDFLSFSQPLKRGLQSLGTVTQQLNLPTVPQKLTFCVQLENPKRENHWDLWVYPDNLVLPEQKTVQIVHSLDASCRHFLEEGKTVLLLSFPQHVQSEVKMGFSSVFWNTSWTEGQAPHTLGIVCDPKHPVFRHFPTDSYTDWQWWELLHDAGAMVLDELPSSLAPLVQPIDTWFRSHKLGLLFECQVEKGKLMVCSMDLISDLDSRMVAKQALYSILAYMEGTDFNPTIQVKYEELQHLFKDQKEMQK